jgi:ferredoxin
MGGKVKLTPHTGGGPQPTLLFGLRPCDTAAITHLTGFSGAEPADRETLAKRKATKVVTFACAATCERGFCTWAGTGPAASKGFDLQLIPYNDGFVIERGEEGAGGGTAFADYSSVIEEVRADVEEIKAALTRRVSGEQPQYDTRKLAECPSGPLKKEFARRCQKCGGCVYICPTCTCFNIMDRIYGDKGERLKVWDSCFLDGFTVVAGGGNPVRDTEAHLNRRLWCKDTGGKKTRGKPGRTGKCVGCGRCDRVCPGNIGMGSMLELL